MQQAYCVVANKRRKYDNNNQSYGQKKKSFHTANANCILEMKLCRMHCSILGGRRYDSLINFGKHTSRSIGQFHIFLRVDCFLAISTFLKTSGVFQAVVQVLLHSTASPGQRPSDNISFLWYFRSNGTTQVGTVVAGDRWNYIRKYKYARNKYQVA